MNAEDRSELSLLNARLFGLDGNGGLAGEVAEIKNELAEWRGAIRLVRYGAGLLGLGGITTIVVALLNAPK